MAIDMGTRRIGLAISDVTRTLARPLMTITVTDAGEALRRVTDEIARLASDEDGLSTIIVGLPVRLDGSAGEQTSRVAAFVAALKQHTAIAVITADERLSSVEADSRLASRTKSWRERKKKLDAAAAAVILQDYLDGGA